LTALLGLPLAVALERLRAEGESVSLTEVSSKKGSRGDDARVIRTVRDENGTTVYWSRFQTEVKE